MKKIILAVAVAAVATMAIVGSASAGTPPARYQTTTGTLTVSAAGGAYVHTLNVATNPCDNSFTGTGGIADLDLRENVSGTLAGQNIVINGVYLSYFTPFTWSYSGPLTGGLASDSLDRSIPLTFSYAETGHSNFKTHDEYVTSQGGGSDAAHSCIGMPIITK